MTNEERFETLWNEVYGGTDANPQGIKGKVSRLCDDFAEIEKTGVRIIDGKQIQTDHEKMIRLENNEIQDGKSRMRVMEDRQSAILKVIWFLGLTIAGTLIRSFAQ